MKGLEMRKQNNLLKTGVSVFLAASLVTSSAFPTFAITASSDSRSTGTETTTVSNGIEEARIAYENAVKALEKAEAEKLAAEKVLKEKQEVLDAAIEQNKAATEAFQKSQREANDIFNNILEECNAKYISAQEALRQVETEYAQAEDEKVNSETAYSKALSVKEDAQKRYNEAVANNTSLTTALTKAKSDESAAKTAYTKSKDDYEKALASYNQNISLINNRKSLLADFEASKSMLETKKKKLDEKKSEVTAAQNKKSACEEEVADATSNLEKANNKVNEASAAESAANTTYTSAKAKYDKEKAEAQKALDDANAATSVAGKNFLSENLIGDGITYQSMYEATFNDVKVKHEGILETEEGVQRFNTILEHLLMVENLLRSAELSKTGNQHRVSEGLSELKLDYNLMLFSALCNAVSAITQDHTLYAGADFAGVPSTSSIGENLAWAGGDPYWGWYEDEKAFMEEEYAKKAEDPNYQIRYWFGHYLTLTDKDYTVTGMSSDGHNHEQFFSEQAAGKTATPEEFISALRSYSSSYMAAVDEAKNRVNALKTEPDYLLSAKNAYNDAKTNLASMQSNKQNAERRLSTANTALTNAVKDLQTRTQECTYAENQYKEAQKNNTEAKNALSAFDAKYPEIASGNVSSSECDRTKTIMDQKEAAYKAAQNTRIDAESKLEGAKKELTAAQAELNTAEAELASKLSSKNKAVENLKVKKDVLDKASKTLDTTKVKYEQAQRIDRNNPATYETNFPEIKTSETALKTAKKNLDDSKLALDKAEAETKDAQAKYDSALKAYEKALADFNKADEELDKYVSFDISKEEGIKVSGISNKTYTGKALVLKITVTHNGQPVPVKITYPNGNTSVGEHYVYIIGEGEYKGTIKYSFTILPKSVGKRTYTRTKSSIKVAYKKVSNVSGYQIAYRKKGSSKWIYKTTSSTSKTLKSLKKKSRYQIKVRTYKTVNGTKYYSTWSSTATISTK